MKWIAFLFLLVPGVVLAQLELSVDALDFEDVFTTKLDSAEVKLTNVSTAEVTISDIVFYNAAFFTSTNSLPIAANAELDLKIYFRPTHNIRHNSEAIIVLSSGQEYSIDLVGAGRYQDTYYASTFDKSNEALKSELKTILASGYTNLGYTGARDRMYGQIDNVNGKVTCVYTGREATFNTRSGANNNSFNTEHTWPQSLFNQNEPERADIHHLFPTDVNSNSRRGSFPFGVVSSATWSEGGSKLGGGIFEPRDLQKGATARAMLYFAIRYQDYRDFIDGQESTLVQWHKDNPPTSWDSLRNEKIFSFQKNRNPFIDHPEFAERISKFGSNDPFIETKTLVSSQSSVDFGTVNPNTQRTVYFINTGNSKFENISNLSSLNEHISIVDFDTEADAGDAVGVTIGFKSQAAGNYTDELRIDTRGENGQIITLPISFQLETTNARKVEQDQLSSYYNTRTQKISFKNVPENIENVEVYSINGARILLDEISSSFTDIPFRGQAYGIYFVVIETKDNVYTSRFLVH